MKNIGGYFGLECGNSPLYYKDGIYLNSCRNALRYLIRSLKISRIYIPSFTCSAIEDAIKKENCKIIKYNIDKNFFPIQNIPTNEFLIYNNYFGINGARVREMAKIFCNLIVDNSQAFFSDVYGRFSIYSLRKFFGVPDGGILRGRDVPKLNIEKGVSYEATTHLLIRHDLGAQKGYPYFIKDEELIDKYEVRYMSKLTNAIMGNINYEVVKKKRLENFNYLKENLNNFLDLINIDSDIPLDYPLYMENGDKIRTKLISHNIFCATFWPNVIKDHESLSWEIDLTKNVVHLPIDQRYGINDMKFIIETILK